MAVGYVKRDVLGVVECPHHVNCASAVEHHYRPDLRATKIEKGFNAF
jgi:hypothetical protein